MKGGEKMKQLSRLRDNHFRVLVDGWPDETAHFDDEGRCRYANAAMIAAFGPEAALLGLTPAQAWPQSLHAPFLQARLIETAAGRGPAPFEIGLGATAEKRLVQLFPDGEGGAFLVARDVGERDRQELAQRRLNRALRLLSACNQTLVHATDEQKLLEDVCRLVVESGGYRMAWVGYAQHDAAKSVRPAASAGMENDYLDSIQVTWADEPLGRGPTGTAIRRNVTVVNPDFLTESTAKPWREAATARGYRSSVSLPLTDGEEIFGALAIYAAEADAFSGEEIRLLEEMAGDLAFGVATLRSNVRREAAEARLAYLAGHDPLTGLLNRLALREKFAAATAGGGSAALLYVDLDSFKQINDNFDHATGDRLLQVVAGRLGACVADAQNGAAACRHGGDEFVVLLPGADQTAAAQLAKNVLAAIAVPVDLGDGDVVIAASIGVALTPRDGDDFDVALKRADLALHSVKERTRGEFRFYEPGMGAQTAARWRLFADLRRGLDHGEFTLHYQPQVELATGRVVGAEALARWRSGGGFIPPSIFIPAAEQNGMIVPLGEWAIFEACRQAAAWRRNGVADLVMAVNLSAIQFRRADVTSIVLAALERTGLPPDRLELELTESVLLDDAENVERTIAALKEKGVRFSIDDFGSGYSSLSYLKRLAVDKLKIDQSFVRDLTENNDGAAIVRAIVQLGATLRLTILAEGVETAAQRDSLRRFGCHQAQGYYYSRPVPADEFPAFAVGFS